MRALVKPVPLCGGGEIIVQFVRRFCVPARHNKKKSR
jgi:hypothetical protein